VTQSFAEYHQRGGSVLIFHDVCCTTPTNAGPWNYFETRIGGGASHLGLPAWSRAFRVKGATHPALSFPFAIPDPLPVALTHGAQVTYQEGNAHLVLCGDRGEDSPYYAECEGIGFCEAGHTPASVTPHEFRFFVNVIYHLSAKRPRTIR
jgi:hypothetical protein